MRRQVGRVLAAAAVIGAAVSGCGNHPGTAVIVGADPVPLERVQSQLDSVLTRGDTAERIKAAGVGPDDIAREIVTGAVMHNLLTRRAAETGIAIGDPVVDAAIAAQGGADALLEGSTIDPAGLRDRVRDDLIAVELAKRTVVGQTVTADIVGAMTRKEAMQKANVLAAGGEPAAALLRDPQSAAPAQSFSAATNPDAAGSVLFGVGVGSVGLFQPNPDQAIWYVFKIIDRRTDGAADAGQISQAQLAQMGKRTLQPDAARLGVDVNPRFGVWDPIRLRVVPKDFTAGAIIPPPARSAG